MNKKSSTEAKIVGVFYYLLKCISTRMFLEVQGFTIETNILFQYNQIAVKIEWNGKASSEQKTQGGES